jgi:hypothetical protein
MLLSRRVDGLLKMAGIVLDLRRLGVDVDLRGAKIRAVQLAWMDMVGAVAEEVLPEGAAAVFMESLRKTMEGWQTRLDDSAG